MSSDQAKRVRLAEIQQLKQRIRRQLSGGGALGPLEPGREVPLHQLPANADELMAQLKDLEREEKDLSRELGQCSP
jgi:hypothetical protein